MTDDGYETTSLTGETRLIVCGWCGLATDPDEPCQNCQHVNPAQPWEQRSMTPPQPAEARVGRPPLDPNQIRERLRIARKQLGPDATNEALAEHLGIDVRTLGRWQKKSSC